MAAASAKIPVALKPITPFVLRGRELQKANGDQVVVYFCFQMAMELGLKINASHETKLPEVTQFLGGLMGELEALKPRVGGKSKDEQLEICLAFANQVFERANATDEAGNADKATAQAFYAAATYFDILKQFDPNRELTPDLKEKVLYAKWKATDILKAVQEGRKPQIGGPGSGGGEGESHAQPHAARHDEDEDVPVAAPVEHAPLPPMPPASTPNVRAATSGGGGGGGGGGGARPALTRQKSSLDKKQKSDVLEYLKFARAAVEENDVQSAITKLETALAMLYEN